MKVVGTAGHIDHGKSTLVRRLTGIDPDRLAEEKARGMTIDLGFAWMTLPSGVPISLVDVPGHERFVKNMLAGSGGIDIALLVIAADEGVMPQTLEHLHILDLLGIPSGVVALSKVDLVDEEWRDLVKQEIVESLKGTLLAESPIIPVSATSGSGIEELIQALDKAVNDSPDRPDENLPFLPVDRAFSVPGFGTVVTGTLHRGSFRVDDEVELLPSGRRARVRSLQMHGKQVDMAQPGSRAAVNLHGISRDEVRRGDVLARPGTIRISRRVDVHLRVLDDAPFGLAQGAEMMVHVGASEARARISLFEERELPPGGIGWAQLRFVEPVVAVRGQRFIVRLPAPARTIAGGEIVDMAPRLRGRNEAGLRRLQNLRSTEIERSVLAAVPSDRPRDVDQIASLLGIQKENIQRTLQTLVDRRSVVRLGSGYLSRESWDAVAERATALLLAHHAEFPLRQGIPKEELRSRLGFERAHWNPVFRGLVDAGTVVERGTLVAAPGYRGGTAGREGDVQRTLDVLRRQPFSPPSGTELLDEAGVDSDFLAALTEEGVIVRVEEGLYFTADAYEQMVDWVTTAIREDGSATVAQVRDALSTSRKYALALLEHLDGRRITRRVGDTRVLGSRAPACA